MRTAAVLALVAGCGFSAPAATSDGPPLPDGVTEPDGEAADAAIDAPPAVDSDGDGVVDDLDNCPHDPTPDRHDKDDDGLGDVCDPCPHLKNQNVDTDGDLVGDACDPHPTALGDTRAIFDGFYGTTLDATRWQVIGDPVTVADGVLVAPDAAHSTILVSIDSVRHPTVSMAATVDATSTVDAGTLLLATLMVTDVMHDWSLGCGVVMTDNSDPDSFVQAIETYPADATPPGSVVSGPLPLGAYTFRETLEGRQHTCNVTLANLVELSSGTLNPGTPRSGRVGLQRVRVAARVPYVFVVESP